MTRSDILAGISGAECSVRRNFSELNVAQKALLVRYSANFDLLRNALMFSCVSWGTWGFWLTPPDHCSLRMNKHWVEVRQANRLNRGRERNWIFKRGDRDVGIKVLCVEFPIRMDFYLNQLPLLRRAFKIPQIIFASMNVRVHDGMSRSWISFRPEAMSR